MRKSTLVAGLAGLALLPSTVWAGPPPAADDDLCAPQARGVPYLSPKTPNWWAPPDAFEEERWTGASRHDWSKGAEGASWMRTLWDEASRTLFFQFDVVGDDNPNSGLDHVVIGLQHPGGEQVAIVLDPTQGCPAGPGALCNIDQAIDPGQVLFSLNPVGPAGFGPLDSTPVAGWEVQDPWITATDAVGGGGPFEWSVALKLVVPPALIGADGEVLDNVLIYTDRLMGIDHDGNPGTPPQVVQFPWPRCIGGACTPVAEAAWEVTNADDQAQIPAGIPFANAAALKTGAKANCDFGVLLDRMDVGTDFPAFLGSQIRKSTTEATTFRAQIHNNTDASIDAGKVQADFFIANWGIGGVGATWTKLNPTPVALSAALPAGAVADGSGGGALLEFAWTPASLPAWDHQCVRVQLSTPEPSGPGPVPHEIDFVHDSVYRNMNFVDASVYRQPAEISVAGIGDPADGSSHRVLLRVRTEGMPSARACGQAHEKQQRLEGCDNGKEGRHFTLLEGEARQGKLACIERWKREQAKRGSDNADQAPPAEPSREEGAQMAPDGYPCGEGQVEAEGLPTIVVDAYVTVADHVNTVGHKQVPILRHLGAFGHYVTHEGAIEGWETAIHGAEPAGAGQYVLEIPKDGVKTIYTTIRALDDDTTACDRNKDGEGCDDPSAPEEDTPDPTTTTTTSGGHPGDGGSSGGCCSRCSAQQSPGETLVLLFGGLLGLTLLRRNVLRRR